MSAMADSDRMDERDAATAENHRASVERAAALLPEQEARRLRGAFSAMQDTLAHFDAERRETRELLAEVAAMRGVICTCTNGHARCPVLRARALVGTGHPARA